MHGTAMRFLPSQHLVEIIGNGGIESDNLPCDGMDEAEHCGMQGYSLDGAWVTAILAVAAHWIAQVVHVNANLVLSPSF